jgi:hypothetical protein
MDNDILDIITNPKLSPIERIIHVYFQLNPQIQVPLRIIAKWASVTVPTAHLAVWKLHDFGYIAIDKSTVNTQTPHRYTLLK